jgi:multiple sugar transport system substrate-binding protein
MRKHLGRLALCAVTILMVVSLGFTSLAQAQEAVKLRFIGWGGPEEVEVFRSLVDSFNKANPDIVIEYEPIPDDYVTKLKTQVAGGNAPDIAYVPDGEFSAFAPLGQLVNIQKLVDASKVFDAKNVWPSSLLRYRWDEATKSFNVGDLYALPKDIGPTVLYVNVDLFNKAGVPLPDPVKPLTWDQILDIGNKLTTDKNGKHPTDSGFDANNIEIFGFGDLWVENMIFGNGGRYYSDDKRQFVLPDDENAIAAIQFISDTAHKHHIRPTAQQTASVSFNQLFEAGKVGVTTQGRWQVTAWRKNLPFKWDTIPNPVGPSGKINAADENCSFSGWSGSVGIAIFKGTNGEKNVDKAFKFLEWIAGPEGQKAQAALGFQIPNQVDVANSDAFLQPGQMPANSKVFIEAARCEWPGPWTQTPYFGQWFDPHFWQGAWPAAVNDATQTAKEALQSRKADFQKDLDDAWKRLAEGQ